MDELGQILHEARENKGLTLEEAFQETRINAKYLEALEKGEYQTLPTPVHIRGFLRNYARFLGLDPQPLLDRYAQSNGRQPNPATIQKYEDIGYDIPLPLREEQPFFDPVNVEVNVGSRRDPESVVRIIIIAALIIAVALVVNRFLPMIFNNEDGTEAITENIAGIVDDVLNNSDLSSVESAANVDGAEDLNEPTGEPGEAITSTSRTNEAAVILPTPSPTRPVLPSTLEQINLKLEVTERAWIESTIDDEVVFTGIARPGDVFEWTAEDEAKLLTGNAIGIFVTINDIPIGRLGDRGQNVEEVWKTTQ
jgi:cytoskeletal protein RodZ